MFNDLVRRVGLEPTTIRLAVDNPYFFDPYGISYEQGNKALPLSYRRMIHI